MGIVRDEIEIFICETRIYLGAVNETKMETRRD